MSEFTELLGAAFPRDAQGVPFCAWCGSERHADHALCKRCWFSLKSKQRRDYLALSIRGKANWILAHKPRAAVPA